MREGGLGFLFGLGCLIGHALAALIGVVAMPLRDALVDAWKFNEGAGAVAHGALGVLDLPLSRGSISGTQPLDPLLGWTTEPSGSGSRTTYNGAGTADVTAHNLWAATGQSVTLAFRSWLGGGQIQPFWGATDTHFTGGFGGHYAAGASTPGSGVRFSDVHDGPGLGRMYLEGELPSITYVASPGTWTYAKGASPYKPCLLWLRMTRMNVLSTDVIRVEFAADGVVKAGVIDPEFGIWDPGRVTIGSGLWWSRGSVTQAALWKRAVSDGEIASFGDNLDPLFLEIEASSSPLLGVDGRSAIPFTFGVRRIDRTEVIATSGGKRETRAPHDRNIRSYELTTVRLTDATLGLVRSALEVSRYGLLPVRWRHPTDDPAPPAEAPRYRIVNAADAGVQLSRALGGQRVRVSLVMESV